jgi:hypothetical protein
MTGKQKTTKWIALCLAFFFFATGCATPPSPRYAPTPHFLQQPEGLERRIESIQAILESPQLSLEDRLLAQDLLKTYRAVERVSLRPLDEELQEFMQLLLSSLVQLDDRYFKGRSAKEPEGVEAMTLFSEKRNKLMDSYLTGDYEGVIDMAVEVENMFGADSLSPDIALVFAVSLAKKGMVQEALGLATRIGDDLERIPGVIELRAKMVEWQLALGDKKGAVRTYEKLVDNIHDTEAFLKGAEQKLSGHGQQSVYEQKKKDSRGSIDLTKEPHSLQEVLSEVDALVQKNDFDAAKLLLLRLAIRLQDGAEADLVDQAMKSVQTAEEKAWEQERGETFQKQEALELAADLIEQAKYEEAITEIEKVMWGEELDQEARQLQDLAVEKIVHREREKAGNFFLMARESRDPAKKKEFLLSSYNILKQLIEKYPSTNLYQRITDHIKRIEEELAKIEKSSG